MPDIEWASAVARPESCVRKTVFRCLLRSPATLILSFTTVPANGGILSNLRFLTVIHY
jgi:hypothetical protein